MFSSSPSYHNEPLPKGKVPDEVFAMKIEGIALWV